MHYPLPLPEVCLKVAMYMLATTKFCLFDILCSLQFSTGHAHSDNTTNMAQNGRWYICDIPRGMSCHRRRNDQSEMGQLFCLNLVCMLRVDKGKSVLR